MAAKRKKTPKRGKKVSKTAPRKGAGRKAKAPARRPARKSPAKRAAAGAKGFGKARKPAGRKIPGALVAVTPESLALVQFEPLRAEATAAFSRGETVELRTGKGEDGGRVETLVFAPSSNAVQSLGEYVHRGIWNGEQLVTDKGHRLDADGNCFCRDCETAGGYTIDDDE